MFARTSKHLNNIWNYLVNKDITYVLGFMVFVTVGPFLLAYRYQAGYECGIEACKKAERNAEDEAILRYIISTRLGILQRMEMELIDRDEARPVWQKFFDTQPTNPPPGTWPGELSRVGHELAIYILIVDDMIRLGRMRADPKYRDGIRAIEVEADFDTRLVDSNGRFWEEKGVDTTLFSYFTDRPEKTRLLFVNDLERKPWKSLRSDRQEQTREPARE